ncbi:MAG: hypothetical protein ACFFB2_16525 [Promethearchaeota archaeon]
MNRTIRIRKKEIDVELTLWRLLPFFFALLLIIVSATIIGVSGSAPGAAPPAYE